MPATATTTQPPLTLPELQRQVAYSQLTHLAAGLDPRDLHHLDVNPEVLGLVPSQPPTIVDGLSKALRAANAND